MTIDRLVYIIIIHLLARDVFKTDILCRPNHRGKMIVYCILGK
jgi:hypothetical protein